MYRIFFIHLFSNQKKQSMRLFSKILFNKEDQELIKKEVLKQIKPGFASISNIEIEIPNYKLKANYLLANEPGFTILFIEKTNKGTTPKKIISKKSTKKAKKDDQLNTRKFLMDQKRDYLIKSCEKQKIKHSKSDTKTILVDLLMLNK